MAGRGAPLAASGKTGGPDVTRTHRKIHRLAWALLTLGVGLALLLALLWRDPAHAAALASVVGLGP
jgi:hypothetical protein